MGRVPGDYPVAVGYCTTRHNPDLAGYYFKICPDPDNLSRDSQVGICHVTVFHARHCGVTRDRYLPTWCFEGWADGLHFRRHILNTRIRQLPASGRVVTAGYPYPVPGEIRYPSHL